MDHCDVSVLAPASEVRWLPIRKLNLRGDRRANATLYSPVNAGFGSTTEGMKGGILPILNGIIEGVFVPLRLCVKTN